MSLEHYVVGHSSEAHEHHQQRNAVNTCQYFTRLLQPHFHILDAGCGPGSITASLAALVPQGRAVGIDSAPVVIDKARVQNGLPANCTFQVASVTQLPYPDASFDVVQTSQALVHISDIGLAMRELYRVLKPGGFLACREGDLLAIILEPSSPGLELWWSAMVGMMRGTGSHPGGGRELIKWALDAGFPQSSMWYGLGGLVHATDKAAHVNFMVETVMHNQEWRQKATDFAQLGPRDFERMRDAWEELGRDPAGVFAMPCGELLAHKAQSGATSM